MLAGRIKLKTFLMVTIPVVGILGLGTLYLVERAGMSVVTKVAEAERVDREAFREQAMKRLEEEKKSQSTPESTPSPVVADSSRPWDAFLLARRGQDLGSKKVKDAARAKPYKINLYQDEGHSAINRAKVDIDRDDHWDEKWTFEDGRLSRKVAPADDEDYTQVWVWDGSGWRQ